MKKILVTAFVLCISGMMANHAHAQARFGMGLTHATEFPLVGMNANISYNLGEGVRFQPGFSYYFEQEKLRLWEFNTDIQATIKEDDQFLLYGIMGLSYGKHSTQVEIRENGRYVKVRVGDDFINANLGFGSDFKIPDAKIRPYIEVKYEFGELNQAVFGAGLRF